MKSFVAALRAALKRQGNLRTLCLLVGLLLLALMVWAAGPRQLWDYALRMRWALPAVVAVWGVGYALNACSWGTIIRTNPLLEPLPYGRLYRFTVAGFALNYITPFGLLGGEPYRIAELRRYLGLERAVGSVVLYMMMHVCSHLMLWVSACLLVALYVRGLSAAWGWGFAAVAAVCLGGIYLFFRGYRRGVVGGLLRALSGWPWVGKRIARIKPETQARISLMDENIRRLLTVHPRAFTRSLLLEYASRLWNCAEVYLLLCLLGLPATWWGAVLIVALSSLLANLLFFSPLQLGTREGGILLAMRVVYPESGLLELTPQAVALSLMTRLREFVWIAIGLMLLRVQNKSADGTLS
jgi:hypothetical protein